MDKKAKVLYLSYDGMTDPLGQSQVISYLKKLSAKGHSIDIMGYEKPEVYAQKKAIVEGLLEGTNIRWIPMVYHKSPPIISTLNDISAGWKKIKALHKESPYDIVHCRGYITAILGRRCKKYLGVKYIFDMRGWWADEKLESGFWSSPVYKPVYRYFKFLEERYFKESDISISLTVAGQDEAVRLGYKSRDRIGVIPTCVNFDIFPAFSESIRKEVRAELDIAEDAKVLLYSGSLGGNYGTEIIFDLFKAYKKRNDNAVLLVLSKTDRQYIEGELAKCNVQPADYRIVSADYPQVHRYLMAGDVGVIIYHKTYSVIGRSPTKLGEYWACGLPAISLSGIGDLDYLMDKYEKGGVLMSGTSPREMEEAVERLAQMPVDRDLLRRHAVDYYDLDKGAEKYNELYQKLLA